LDNQKYMDIKTATRGRVLELSKESNERGDAAGWFEKLYAEAEGNAEKLPWGNLSPNEYLVSFAEKTALNGNGRTALVVGCGLGDDAKYLEELGFKVTAFDISPTAIDWAKHRYSETKIEFQVADLFETPKEWNGAFDFVLEIYTIQPLPLEIRPQVIDEVAKFVKKEGKLVVVTRGRENDETLGELPWALSRNDLSRFAENNLKETYFEEVYSSDEIPVRRFVIEYVKI
jgi:SAM-dependent methyltransferase